MRDFLLITGSLFGFMTVAYVVSLLRRRNDVADVAWGLGFMLVAWLTWLMQPAQTLRATIVVALITIWGVRLAWHIFQRNQGKPEDYRYLAWRKEWGNWFYLRSFLQVFMLQGFLLLIISLPVMAAISSSQTSLTGLDLLGVIVWLIGFGCESLADAQLKRFKAEQHPKGTILQTGLWRYSRHPNYFGEVTQWWGIWLLAAAVAGGAWTIIGPLTITFLILKVSGVPLLEAKMAQNPAFAEYKRRTSVFIPWFVKK